MVKPSRDINHSSILRACYPPTDADCLSNVQSTPGRRKVRAINPYYSFLNHSCEPNADFSKSMPMLLPCEDGSQKYLFAINKIKKGEEITVSYLGSETVSLHRRLPSTAQSRKSSWKQCLLSCSKSPSTFSSLLSLSCLGNDADPGHLHRRARKRESSRWLHGSV